MTESKFENIRPIPVNPSLVWDYEIPDENDQTLAFQKWYVARVLTKGTSKEISAIGKERIIKMLPDLNLPRNIRGFWEWYADSLE